MKKGAMWPLCLALIGAGCTSDPNPPLIFGQSHTYGVSVGGTTATQGVDLTLGYRDLNIAIVPVTVSNGDGSVTQLTSSASGHTDALSVLGQFDAGLANGTEASLGKFFATGLAAKVLADGFAGNPPPGDEDPDVETVEAKGPAASMAEGQEAEGQEAEGQEAEGQEAQGQEAQGQAAENDAS